MSRRRDRGGTSAKYEKEQRFPFKVDVPVPGCGLGQRLIEMHDWCDANAGEWDHHTHTERGKIGERFRYYVRFYFMTEKDAEAFRRAWLTDTTSNDHSMT